MEKILMMFNMNIVKPINRSLYLSIVSFLQVVLVVRKMIQVDIGGHPPFLTGSKQFSGNFGNLLFLAGFNFWGHFEGPNEGFSR
jgi:hypothetical protein